MADMTSGERLRAYVIRTWAGGRGMVGLSEQSGISRDRLYAWFRGDVEPTLGSLGELAKALGVRRAEVVAAIDGELPPPNWRDDLRAVVAEAQPGPGFLERWESAEPPAWAAGLASSLMTEVLGAIRDLQGNSMEAAVTAALDRAEGAERERLLRARRARARADQRPGRPARASARRARAAG